jgi:hypothetical protein
LFATTGQDDFRTGLGECDGSGFTDAGRSAGDQSDFIFAGVSVHRAGIQLLVGLAGLVSG